MNDLLSPREPLLSILQKKHVVVCTGSEGVGKTTIAAALVLLTPVLFAANSPTAGDWLDRGFLHAKRYETKKERAAYREALALEPGYQDAYAALAMSNYTAEDGSIDVAALDREQRVQFGLNGNAKITGIDDRAEVAVGDTVVVTGNIVLDKDFGAGYRFPVLLEDASITAE